jgi:hypothetical protein
MKIWAHTLFKNEERWLWFSVTSVIDHIDKLLLWDTGSTDRSWEIASLLKKKYGDKIDLRQFGTVTPKEFANVRQEMLNVTEADWFLIVDGDEIWWDDSIKKIVSEIKKIDNNVETIVVPNINLLGDIYHYQSSSDGRYTFGKLVGNYALRAVKRSIAGLNSKGRHGIWGWADENNNQIQNRNTYKFVYTPYIHTTFLPRGESREDDIDVPKRAKKLKYEIGIEVPKDFYYPEAFFRKRPDFVKSPWQTSSLKYKFFATILTPIKRFRRHYLMKGVKDGY